MKILLDLALVIAIIVPIAVASCMFGVIATLRSLEHYTYTKVIDGKEELRIRLFLGPLSYTVVVPEKSGEGKSGYGRSE
ncbi:MAG: hypothetical protein ACRDBZ_06425 [Citrobacter braakii]